MRQYAEDFSDLLGDSESAPAAGRWALLAGFVAFVFFAWLAPAAMPSGDAALYAQQALRLELSERTVHIGYYVLAAVFTLFQSSAPDLVFNLFSGLAGAATVALICFATARVSGRIELGLLAGFSLCASSTFVRQAAWAEVYAGQAFFFVLALWLVLLARPAWAGLSLAGSVLFSPSTLLGVPGLLLAKPGWRTLWGLGLCGGGVVLAVLAFVWRDYFLGPRGLFGAAPTAGGPAQAVVKEGFEVIYGVTSLLPFLALGVLGLLRHRRGRAALAVLVTLWAPTFHFGERYPDVPVQLPTWVLLAPVLAAGAAELESRLRGGALLGRSMWLLGSLALALMPLLAIPVVASRSRAFALLGTDLLAGLVTLCVAAAGLALWLSGQRPRWAVRALFVGWMLVGVVLGARLVTDQNERYVAYKVQVQGLAEVAAERYVAIGSWEQGILLEHYLYGRPYTGHTLDIDALRRADAESSAELERVLEQGGEIWLLQPDEAIEHELIAAGRELRPVSGFRVARSPSNRSPSSGSP